jgi:hypothetical protein
VDTSVAARPRFGAALALAVAVAFVGGCGPGIGGINGRPDQFYGKRVSLQGRISDVLVRDADGKTLVFHLVSRSGERIIVASSRPTWRREGNHVRVRGTFSSEHTVGDRKLYDVVVTDRVRRPRWLGIPFL